MASYDEYVESAISTQESEQARLQAELAAKQRASYESARQASKIQRVGQANRGYSRSISSSRSKGFSESDVVKAEAQLSALSQKQQAELSDIDRAEYQKALEQMPAVSGDPSVVAEKVNEWLEANKDVLGRGENYNKTQELIKKYEGDIKNLQQEQVYSGYGAVKIENIPQGQTYLGMSLEQIKKDPNYKVEYYSDGKVKRVYKSDKYITATSDGRARYDEYVPYEIQFDEAGNPISEVQRGTFTKSRSYRDYDYDTFDYKTVLYEGGKVKKVKVQGEYTTDYSRSKEGKWFNKDIFTSAEYEYGGEGKLLKAAMYGTSESGIKGMTDEETNKYEATASRTKQGIYLQKLYDETMGINTEYSAPPRQIEKIKPVKEAKIIGESKFGYGTEYMIGDKKYIDLGERPKLKTLEEAQKERMDARLKASTGRDSATSEYAASMLMGSGLKSSADVANVLLYANKERFEKTLNMAENVVAEKQREENRKNRIREQEQKRGIVTLPDMEFTYKTPELQAIEKKAALKSAVAGKILSDLAISSAAPKVTQEEKQAEATRYFESMSEGVSTGLSKEASFELQGVALQKKTTYEDTQAILKQDISRSTDKKERGKKEAELVKLTEDKIAFYKDIGVELTPEQLSAEYKYDRLSDKDIWMSQSKDKMVSDIWGSKDIGFVEKAATTLGVGLFVLPAKGVSNILTATFGASSDQARKESKAWANIAEGTDNKLLKSFISTGSKLQSSTGRIFGYASEYSYSKPYRVGKGFYTGVAFAGGMYLAGGILGATPLMFIPKAAKAVKVGMKLQKGFNLALAGYGAYQAGKIGVTAIMMPDQMSREKYLGQVVSDIGAGVIGGAFGVGLLGIGIGTKAMATKNIQDIAATPRKYTYGVRKTELGITIGRFKTSQYSKAVAFEKALGYEYYNSANKQFTVSESIRNFEKTNYMVNPKGRINKAAQTWKNLFDLKAADKGKVLNRATMDINPYIQRVSDVTYKYGTNIPTTFKGRYIDGEVVKGVKVTESVKARKGTGYLEVYDTTTGGIVDKLKTSKASVGKEFTKQIDITFQNGKTRVIKDVLYKDIGEGIKGKKTYDVYGYGDKPKKQLLLEVNKDYYLHGTSSKFLNKIKKEGIKPGSDKKVYLTQWGNYARLRAEEAILKGGKPIILKIKKGMPVEIVKGRHLATSKTIKPNKIIEVIDLTKTKLVKKGEVVFDMGTKIGTTKIKPSIERLGIVNDGLSGRTYVMSRSTKLPKGITTLTSKKVSYKPTMVKYKGMEMTRKDFISKELGGDINKPFKYEGLAPELVVKKVQTRTYATATEFQAISTKAIKTSQRRVRFAQKAVAEGLAREAYIGEDVWSITGGSPEYMQGIGMKVTSREAYTPRVGKSTSYSAYRAKGGITGKAVMDTPQGQISIESPDYIGLEKTVGKAPTSKVSSKINYEKEVISREFNTGKPKVYDRVGGKSIFDIFKTKRSQASLTFDVSKLGGRTEIDFKGYTPKSVPFKAKVRAEYNIMGGYKSVPRVPSKSPVSISSSLYAGAVSGISKSSMINMNIMTEIDSKRIDKADISIILPKVDRSFDVTPNSEIISGRRSDTFVTPSMKIDSQVKKDTAVKTVVKQDTKLQPFAYSPDFNFGYLPIGIPRLPLPQTPIIPQPSGGGGVGLGSGGFGGFASKKWTTKRVRKYNTLNIMGDGRKKSKQRMSFL